MMARKKITPVPQHIEPEAETRDNAATQGGGQEGHGFAPGDDLITEPSPAHLGSRIASQATATSACPEAK